MGETEGGSRVRGSSQVGSPRLETCTQKPGIHFSLSLVGLSGAKELEWTPNYWERCSHRNSHREPP